MARAQRRGDAEEEFIAPLPRDENWITDLGSDVPTGAPADAGRAGPAPLTWLAVEESLREQRALIADLTARLDALERSVAEDSKRRLVSIARSTSRFVGWLTARFK